MSIYCEKLCSIRSNLSIKIENEKSYYIILEYCPGRDLVHNLILYEKFNE